MPAPDIRRFDPEIDEAIGRWFLSIQQVQGRVKAQLNLNVALPNGSVERMSSDLIQTNNDPDEAKGMAVDWVEHAGLECVGGWELVWENTNGDTAHELELLPVAPPKDLI